ncbi:MAG: APC family permease [Rubrobacteraceae bacterium]
MNGPDSESAAPASSRRVLGVFTIAMFNVAAIVSLNNVSTLAELGLEAIFYLVVATVVFLLPAALVSAELATGWTGGGGLYDWIKAALGPGWGFLGIWLFWCSYMILFPTILSFVAASLAYLWNPSLAANKLYTLGVILVVTWTFTLANFRGMKISGWISSAGVVVGTLVPGGLIFVLGILWLLIGEPSRVSFDPGNFLPNLGDLRNVVFLSTVFFFFAGTEMSAVHAREVRNPSRHYPRAILLSSSIIIVLYAAGTLAIAAVVPQKEISLAAGVMEAFTAFFAAYDLSWLVPPVALLLVFGGIGMLNALIIGPSKGLLVAAEDGNMPAFFQRVNEHRIPTHLLATQAVIVSLVSLVFLLEPTVNSSFYLLLALTTKLYLVVYILMMAAAVRLRYKAPEVERAYRVPGGMGGIWVVAGTGIFAAVFAIITGFIPPAQIDTGSTLAYEAFLVAGIFVFSVAGFAIYRYSRASRSRKT